MKRPFLLLILFLALALSAGAGENSSNLNFLVVKADNGKPVRNAAVVLHPVNKDGSQSRGGFELKTDADGKAVFPGAPYGKLRVQVLVRGFQTYGEDFEVNQPEHSITIKLQRPRPQYSIYEDKPAEEKKPEEKSKPK